MSARFTTRWCLLGAAILVVPLIPQQFSAALIDFETTPCGDDRRLAESPPHRGLRRHLRVGELFQ